jgi:hypothetical protein
MILISFVKGGSQRRRVPAPLKFYPPLQLIYLWLASENGLERGLGGEVKMMTYTSFAFIKKSMLYFRSA